MERKLRERRFKIGDLVVCAKPEQCKLPADQVATVVALYWWNIDGKEEPGVKVDYGFVVNSPKRREWVFNHWSPTPATDAGAVEYEEVMAIQEAMK